MKTLKERQQLEELARYVRRGGELKSLRPVQVQDLQDHALDIKDVKLYDYLEAYWHGKKAVRS